MQFTYDLHTMLCEHVSEIYRNQSKSIENPSTVYKYTYMYIDDYICVYIYIYVHMYIHTCIHTCILDLGSFVLDLICILPLDLRVFCFCSHFGYQAKQPCCWLITIACQWHPVNGLLAAISRLHHGPRQPTNRGRCRTVQIEIGGWSVRYGHGLVR